MPQITATSRLGQPTLTLEDETASMRAEIAPGRGALLLSLERAGREYIYFDPDNFTSPDRPRCGMPVLFPCCGRSAGETVHLAGGSYPMPIHGFAHTSAWSLAGQGSGITAAWATLCLTDSPATHAHYPFSFRLKLTFRLGDGCLTVEHTCVNTGAAPLPYDFGYHPYFTMSDLAATRITVPGQLLSGTLPAGPETGCTFSHPASGTVCEDRGDGRSVRLEHTENFDNLVLWSVPAKGFLCVEPWQGGPNGLNTGASVLLPPGERAAGSIVITPY